MPSRPYTGNESEILIEFLDPDGNLLETYSIDATESFTPTFGQSVTQNYVEDGADLTDHMRPTPVQISITGFMSDAPMNATGAYDPYDARAFKDLNDASFQTEDGEYNGDYTGPNQVRMDRALQQAVATKQRVNIDAGPVKGVYERMVITSYSPGWNNQDGQSMPFTLQLQILTATTDKKQLPTPAMKQGIGNVLAAGQIVEPPTTGIPGIRLRLGPQPVDTSFMKLEGMVRRGDVAARLADPDIAGAAHEMAFYLNEPIDETAPGFAAALKGIQQIGL